MAVTIIQEPAIILPSSNPLVFVFESDQTAQPNFSFYVEVYVDSQLHSAHQVFREYNNCGKIDLSQIMRGITYTPALTDGFDQNYEPGFYDYSITVYEKYGTPPTLQGSDLSNVLKTFNGSLKHQDWLGFNYELYDVRETNGSLFLTDFPRLQKALCRYDDNYFLGMFTRRAAAVPLPTFTMSCTLFDIGGNAIVGDTVVLTNPRMRVINVGPYQIVANMAGITSGDFTNCYYYEVWVEMTGTFGTHDTEFYRIYLDQSCEVYTPQVLVWLNKYGVYDQYSFDLVSQDTANITAQDYMGLLGQWETGDGGDQWLYNNYQAEKQHYVKEVTEFTLLNSDWIKQDIQHWLVEGLLESPRVYLTITPSRFEPVKVNTSNYTKKLKRKDGLLQESVLLERTYQYVSQLN